MRRKAEERKVIDDVGRFLGEGSPAAMWERAARRNGSPSPTAVGSRSSPCSRTAPSGTGDRRRGRPGPCPHGRAGHGRPPRASRAAGRGATGPRRILPVGHRRQGYGREFARGQGLPPGPRSRCTGRGVRPRSRRMRRPVRRPAIRATASAAAVTVPACRRRGGTPRSAERREAGAVPAKRRRHRPP